MLAYAADRRPVRHIHSKTLALIVAGHGVLLLAVMTARGDLVASNPFDKTEVTLIDPLDPPPPPPPPPEAEPTPSQPARSTIDTPPTIVPTPAPAGPAVDPGPPVVQPGPTVGKAIAPTPVPIPTPPAAVVKVGPRPLTRDADLIPPYPDDKLRLGEEAVIRLSLGIDPAGRVVSVSPVGRADPSFVEAARKHIVRRWRYRPATEDGHAVASSLTVSIRFAIDR